MFGHVLIRRIFPSLDYLIVAQLKFHDYENINVTKVY